MDQRGLARTVRPKQRKDLTAADIEVDAFERLEARLDMPPIDGDFAVTSTQMHVCQPTDYLNRR
jgi:hypothetical protein